MCALKKRRIDNCCKRARVLVYFSDYEVSACRRWKQHCGVRGGVFRFAADTRIHGEAGLPFSNADFESFRRAMEQAVILSPDREPGVGDQLLARHTWERVAHRVVSALSEVP